MEGGEDGAGEVVWGVVMVGGAGMLMGVGGGWGSVRLRLRSLFSISCWRQRSHVPLLY